MGPLVGTDADAKRRQRLPAKNRMANEDLTERERLGKPYRTVGRRSYSTGAAGKVRQTPVTFALGGYWQSSSRWRAYGVGRPSLPTLRAMGAMLLSQVREGEYWRMITGGYVHIGLRHLLGNLVSPSLLFR